MHLTFNQETTTTIGFVHYRNKSNGDDFFFFFFLLPAYDDIFFPVNLKNRLKNFFSYKNFIIYNQYDNLLSLVLSQYLRLLNYDLIKVIITDKCKIVKIVIFIEYLVPFLFYFILCII